MMKTSRAKEILAKIQAGTATDEEKKQAQEAFEKVKASVAKKLGPQS